MNERRLNAVAGAASGRGGPADAVVEQPAPGHEQLVEPLEVRLELGEADVLEHPDRADRVVRAVVDVAVVLQPDLDRSGEPGLGDPLLRELGLAPRDRDADGAHAVVARRVHDHPAPTAADVEQAHARLERELAADQLVLRGLRGVEPDVAATPTPRTSTSSTGRARSGRSRSRRRSDARSRRRRAPWSGGGRAGAPPPGAAGAAGARRSRRAAARSSHCSRLSRQRREPVAQLEHRRRCRPRRRGRRRRTPGRSRARPAR